MSLDESTWMDCGEEEGHITNRAIVNQNIFTSIQSKTNC